MNFLITGVAGFIGKNLAKSLIKAGHSVWGLDNFHNSNQACLVSGVTFIETDVADGSWRKKISNVDFDVIFHLAAQSSGELSFSQPEYDLDTNIKGTMQVCLFAKQKKIKKIVFASSMSVYGETQGAVKECDVAVPLSLYAVGKKCSEDYLRIFSSHEGFEVINLRLFNVYGNGQNMSNLSQGMVSIFLAQLLSEQQFILVKGGLERFRDFIHVYDVVRVLSYFGHREVKRGQFETFNVGTGVKTKVCELITQLQESFQIFKKLEVVDGTKGDQEGIIANTEKLSNEIQFAKMGLQDGLRLWSSSLDR